MEPDASDSETELETMTIRLGLCLRFTLLTPLGVFALSTHRNQCSASLHQLLFLPICPTAIQEEPGQIASEGFGGPVTIISTALLDSTMARYQSELNRNQYGVLSDHEIDTVSSRLSPAPPSRSITDITPYAEQAFVDLHRCIQDGSFFSISRDEVLQVLKRTFSKELEYLKSAYAAACPDPADLQSPSPSQFLFRRRIPEVDRTLTGILALRWLRNNDYKSFTKNQASASRLSQRSFQELRAFFDAGLKGYADHQAVLTLVFMQMTNDLGKSTTLAHELESRLPAGVRPSSNHDMLIQQVLQYCNYLIPSFQCLPRQQTSLVYKLILLSAGFNPGQLVQAESPPAALNTLLELQIDSAELDMKFMELFLDVAGARGHIDHEGAATMNEPTFQGYMQARISSLKIIDGQLRPKQAYEDLLQHRLRMLSDVGYKHKLNIVESSRAFAKVRLFCMGRVSDADTAALYDGVYEQLPSVVQDRLENGLGIHDSPAVQPTYMPAMLAWLRGPNRPLQLTGLLTYLARVVYLSEKDLKGLPQNVEIVERDVKDILEPLVKSAAFRDQPLSVVNDKTELPRMEIVKRSATQSRPP